METKIENKYYTPSIEDLHVGYEIESHECSMDERGVPELNYDRWVKMPLDKSYLTTILKYGLRGIRVLYLTQQQIEDEGWTYSHTNFNDWVFKKGIYTFQYLYDKKAGYISEITDPHGYGGEENFVIFRGNCKSINEFKQIQKLLGI